MGAQHDIPPSDAVSRRRFFAQSAGAVLGASLFQPLVARSARAGQPGRSNDVGYGPLRPAGDELALPPGFQYSIVSIEGQTMDDGFPVPKAMDGMAAFPLRNGNILLIRNHEDNDAASRFRPRPPGSTSTTAGILNSFLNTRYGPRSFAYDAYTGGGTTSIEVEPHGLRRRVGQHWSLVGTFRNCAGGPTPWGSWLSCEETLESASSSGAEKNHGYVFEVPINTRPGEPVVPIPLRQLGRFSHEAVAVDPATGIIYETEDQGDTSGLYRFTPGRKPSQPGELAALNGTLEMVRVDLAPNYETAIGQTVGDPLPVSWVPVPNPDLVPASVTIGGVTMSAVFKQGLDAGGAVFRRVEGCWFSEGKVYFHCTNGGDLGLGQVWVLDVATNTLTLLFESPSVDVFDGPDNICVSPRGGLVVCEDASGAQYLRGLTPDGQVFDFGRNLHNTFELAGACFSPDGQTLFVNLFGRGNVRTTQPYRSPVLIPIGPDRRDRAMTLAIWGPWGAGPL